MAEKLVIVESPTKARTISHYLGKGYRVEASGGHVRDLPEDEFGVDVEHGFEPTYRLMSGKTKTIGNLKKISAAAQAVYLAPDPDREGEAIAWHLKFSLGLPEEKVRRAAFHEITPGAVREALAHPREIDMNLVNAQQARRILDRIVGYELSPLISKKITRGLSAGRVQSVALRLICEREAEIRAFKKEEFWTVVATLRGENQQEFEAEMREFLGKKLKIRSLSEASDLVEKVRTGPFTVSSAIKTERVSKSPPPFITSTLQQVAAYRLRFRARDTMKIAQQLYEGVEVSGQSEGLITYMRTDSTRISDQALAAVRGLIQEQYGMGYLPPTPNSYKSPRAAQAAHEAIRPTDLRRTPTSMKQFLDDRQWKLYDLIWRRFVASQMMPARYWVTSVEIRVGDALFVASGREMIFDGFTRVAKESAGEDQLLPPLKQGDSLTLSELVALQNFTQPPPRYTEGTLIKELEKRGIGRPSTYAPTVSTLLERNYARSRSRTLFPTELGMVVSKALVENFPREVDYGFTSDMEEKLDEVESGKTEWRDILSDFYGKFKQDLEKARTEMKAVSEFETADQRTCEKCGKIMVVKFSRKGDKFLGCSGYPECDSTVWLTPRDSGESEMTDHKCPKCGSPMLLRQGRGRWRSRYFACSAYPKCSCIMGVDKEGNPVERKARSPEFTCEKCGKRMAYRQGASGLVLQCAGCSHEKPQPLFSLEEAYKKSDPGQGAAQLCDQCRSSMILWETRKGCFWKCSKSPECQGTRNLNMAEMPAPVPTNEKCDKCGMPLILRWGRFGRFFACSGFPKCRNAKQVSVFMPPCSKPGCTGRMVRKANSAGADYYGCTLFPECEFTTESAPRTRARKSRAKKDQ